MPSDPLYNGHGSKFFDDQQIYSQDLNNIEYTKLKIIRDSLAACISQAGVAIDSLSSTDLKVVYIGAKHFTVNPGTAIDKYGRIIYVPSSTAASGSVSSDPYYHPEWPSRQNIAHNQLPNEPTAYYVNIYYTTQQDIAETDDEEVLHYTREYDSYRIVCENIVPSENSGGLCLASFQISSDGNIPGSGSINDLRPLLLLSTVSNPSARELYRQTSIASNTVDAEASAYDWSESGAVFSFKATTLFRYDSEETVNVNFCVPSGSGDGALKVRVRFDESGGVGSGSFSSPGSYSFSFNILSGLVEDVVYYIYIQLKSDDAGTALVRNTVIDVV